MKFLHSLAANPKALAKGAAIIVAAAGVAGYHLDNALVQSLVNAVASAF